MFYEIHDDIARNNLKNRTRKNKDDKDNYTTEIVAEQMQLLWGTVASYQRRIEAYSGVFGRIVVLDGNQGAITEAPTGVPAYAPPRKGKAPCTDCA